MNSHQKMVEDFYRACGIPIPSCPVDFSELEASGEIRVNLLLEEIVELTMALRDKNYVEFIDALGDILYLAYGSFVVAGLDAEEVFKLIQESNMTKSDGAVRADGKIIKGPNFRPPLIEEWLESKKL